MMELDRTVMELLRPAVDALRRALRRMDESDVPAPLRTLADSSARRVPPPILKRALTELDRSEWLRAEVAAEGGLTDGSAAELFVLRPESWQERLAELVEETDQHRDARQRSTLERRLAEALARIDELESDLKAGAVDVAGAERRARDRLTDRIERAERARRDAERRARDEARHAARMSSRVERLEAELAAAEEKLERLRQMLGKERRASPTPAPGPVRGSFPDDPRRMAEELDRVTAATRRQPRHEPPPPADRSPLRLPEGIRPDRAEAIRWLMSRPLRWLVDGYNVAFQVAGEPDSATRARLIAAAGHISALAAPGSMAVVVFDSSLDTSSIPTSRRARVVYAHSADQWIVDHAGPDTVVVSSDREVREGAEQAGAIGVWSEALAAWIDSGLTLGPNA